MTCFDSCRQTWIVSVGRKMSPASLSSEILCWRGTFLQSMSHSAPSSHLFQQFQPDASEVAEEEGFAASWTKYYALCHHLHMLPGVHGGVYSPHESCTSWRVSTSAPHLFVPVNTGLENPELWLRPTSQFFATTAQNISGCIFFQLSNARVWRKLWFYIRQDEGNEVPSFPCFSNSQTDSPAEQNLGIYPETWISSIEHKKIATGSGQSPI